MLCRKLTWDHFEKKIEIIEQFERIQVSKAVKKPILLY